MILADNCDVPLIESIAKRHKIYFILAATTKAKWETNYIFKLDVNWTNSFTIIVQLDHIQAGVIITILYYEVFEYPLRPEELYAHQGWVFQKMLFTRCLRTWLIKTPLKKEGFCTFHRSPCTKILSDGRKVMLMPLRWCPRQLNRVNAYFAFLLFAALAFQVHSPKIISMNIRILTFCGN